MAEETPCNYDRSCEGLECDEGNCEEPFYSKALMCNEIAVEGADEPFFGQCLPYNGDGENWRDSDANCFECVATKTECVGECTKEELPASTYQNCLDLPYVKSNVVTCRHRCVKLLSTTTEQILSPAAGILREFREHTVERGCTQDNDGSSNKERTPIFDQNSTWSRIHFVEKRKK